MKLYTNTQLRALTVEGNTKSDKAIETWNKMNFMERFEIMEKVKSFKAFDLYQRACINYVYDNVL